MNLELKYLAPYLPYNLKIVNYNVGNMLKEPLISIMIASSILNFTDGSTEYKILLRPLSDIKDGENNTVESISKCCYSYVSELISQHFDVFGLIEKGLAVDINTLNNK